MRHGLSYIFLCLSVLLTVLFIGGSESALILEDVPYNVTCSTISSCASCICEHDSPGCGISFNYFQICRKGSPTLSRTTYGSCMRSLECVAQCIEKYVTKFSRSCAGTTDLSLLTCIDIARIHKGGWRDCDFRPAIYFALEVEHQCCGRIVEPAALWWNDCGESKYTNAADFTTTAVGADGVIVGGQNAQANEFPWQVSMQFRPGFSADHVHCGGSIIHPRWVVTAAHCVEYWTASEFIIIVGDHNLNEFEGSEVGINVAEIFMHEEYGLGIEYDHDIALLHLETEITFNANVQPACQPQVRDFVGETVQTCGWGNLQPGFGYPEVLQWVELEVTTNEECETLVQQYLNNDITENMICGGFEDHQARDSCQGDSGGPFTVKNSDGRFELIGVVSWGYSCAGGAPGVYARVTRYIEWVTDILALN